MKELILLNPGSPIIPSMQTALNSFYASLVFTIIGAVLSIAVIALVNMVKKSYVIPADDVFKKRVSTLFTVCAALALLTVIYFITQLILLFSSLEMYNIMNQKPDSQDVISDVLSLVFALVMVIYSVMALFKIRAIKKSF